MTEDVSEFGRDEEDLRRVRGGRRTVGVRRSRSNPDQRLLDTGSQLNTSTDMWRVLRIQSEFIEGFGALAPLGPAVSRFGSARIGPYRPTYPLHGDLRSGEPPS